MPSAWETAIFANLRAVGLAVCASLSLAGCSAKIATVENPHPVAYMPEREPASSLPAQYKVTQTSWAGATTSCSIQEADSAKDGANRWSTRSEYRQPPSLVRLSRGDVINVMLPDGQEFNGDYTVGPDGKISLPYLRGLQAAGLSEAGLERRIRDALIDRNLFSPELARVAVRIVHYAAIHVRVQGAVFQPGSHTINVSVFIVFET